MIELRVPSPPIAVTKVQIELLLHESPPLPPPGFPPTPFVPSARDVPPVPFGAVIKFEKLELVPLLATLFPVVPMAPVPPVPIVTA